MKNEKGITLIALVITIIVMLILVAVTISMAINGGLFGKATEASRKMQIEADREELYAAVLDTMDNGGQIHLEDVMNNLDSNKWRYDSTTKKFISRHDNNDSYKFKVNVYANGGFGVVAVEAPTPVEGTIYELTMPNARTSCRCC